MPHIRRVCALILIMGFAVSSAQAETRHVVDPSTLSSVVQGQAATVETNRAVIRDVLARPELAEIARDAGLDLERLTAAVSTLSPTDAEGVASVARDVNQSLVGGASKVTISTTTIIIGLLVLILLIVAVD